MIECGFFDFLTKFVGDLATLIRGNFRQHDDKFLAAKPGNQIGFSKNLFENYGHPLKHLISLDVPVYVIVGLKVVEVEHQDR